jgi:hypothetical protein
VISPWRPDALPAGADRICVWDTRTPKGWRGTADEVEAGAVPTCDGVDAVAAFRTRYPTDAHAVGYLIPGEEQQPRVNLEALPGLIKAGVEPVARWLFVDVDNADHGKWSTAQARVAVSGLFDAHAREGGVLEAAGYYTTSGGYRLVWRFEVPIAVSYYNAYARAWLERLSKALGIPLIDSKVAGMGGIDPTCAQWNRCFRMPFVVRDGVAQEPAINLSRCLEHGLQWVPPVNLLREVPIPSAGSVDHGAAGAPGFPTVDDVTPAQWEALSVSVWFDQVKDGKRLAGKGSRDTALMKAIGDVVGILDATDPAVPWRVLARAVAADTTEGAPTLEKLWDRCRYICRKQADQHAVAKMIEVQPAIVFSAGTRPYYVWNEQTSGYEPPVTGVALLHGLETYCPSMGLQTRKPTGGARDTAELLAAYGAPARQVVAEMGRPLTTYDRESATLYERCCALRPCEPVRHDDVDTWLRLFGATAPDMLLDWLATVTDLSLPTSALYVEGDRSAGKGMFAQGLASLWSPSASPTMYTDAVGAFNGALATCPVVFADENVGKDGHFSAGFRSLTGNSTHRLSRKGIDVATLIGCPRVYIAANNGDALRLREQLTAVDLDAIVARILYVRAATETGAYLSRLGGRARGTAEWVTRAGKPGKIAEHVHYLRETRRVADGDRFLIEGVLTDFHRDLTLSSGLSQQVLAVIAHHVHRAQAPAPGIFVGDGATVASGAPAGVVLVNAQALKGAWLGLTNTPPPAENEIASTLKALARGQYRPRVTTGEQVRCHAIPVGSVLRVAELLQIGDPERLERRLREGIGAAASAAQGVQT